jgi:hypothetical protein
MLTEGRLRQPSDAMVVAGSGGKATIGRSEARLDRTLHDGIDTGTLVDGNAMADTILNGISADSRRARRR